MNNNFGQGAVGRVSRMVIFGLAVLAIGGSAAQAQEKRTVFTQDNFHWQAQLAAGQAFEVIGRNGGNGVHRAPDASAPEYLTRRGHSHWDETFIVVEETSHVFWSLRVYAR